MTESPSTPEQAAASAPSPSSVLSRALRYGGILTLAIAVVGSILGYLAAGSAGLIGALVGAALAAVFMGLTAVSMLGAARVARNDIVVYFGIVLGSWILKLVIFLLGAVWLGSQPWLDPAVFGFAVIAAVVGSLVVDVVVFQRSRTPYVDVSLPGDSSSSADKSRPDS